MLEQDTGYLKQRLRETSEHFPEFADHFTIEDCTVDKEKDTVVRLWVRQILPDGSLLAVNISRHDCDLSNKRDLMNIWKSSGYVKEALPNWWHIEAYHTLAKTVDPIHCEGSCWGHFNPQLSKDGKIDFKWVLPCSWKNLAKILHEIEKRALKETSPKKGGRL